MDTPTLTADEDSRPAGPAEVAARIGQYEVIRHLGSGGMADVHLARDLRLGRLVAVKLLVSQADRDDRLLAEARATARCHHDNIVVIHEVGAHRGRPYMVLEYLEGETLRQWRNAHPGPVPPIRAVELILPVVRALTYAHAQGIVHRDLKPENVMLTRAGGVKVLDFGIATYAVEQAAPAGTLPYMAPEQLTGGAIDPRTDVWAVGIMLFELVAGAHPLRNSDVPLRAMIADATPVPRVAERVTELGPLAEIIDRCLIKDPAHRTTSAQALLAELEPLARRRVAAAATANPFAGLVAFQEADAGRFFGRDRDIDLVVAELRARPLVAVVGPSGTGKSSLVRAGVLPALKRSGEGWDTHVIRPGHDPLAALAGVLDGAPDAARLRDEPGYLGSELRRIATQKRRRIALFVDQLEELYTLGAPPEDRAAWFACLAAIADDPASPLRVVVAIRADFLDRLTEDRRIGAAVSRGLVLLPAMDRDGLREALRRPLEDSEHRFESPALLDRMIDALADTPGALPLLQCTVMRLWDQRDPVRRVLTEASYDELGGVAGALARHADAVLHGLSAAQQALTRTIFERLVTPDRTRSSARVEQLQALRSDPALVDDVLQRLAAMRLMVIERGPDGTSTAELAHDSLIDRWPTLARWLDENHDDAAMCARLRTVAMDWEHSGHATGLLWTGAVADEARAWHARYRGELAPVEQRYLAAVLASSARSRRIRRRTFTAALAVALAVALTMAWLAWKQTGLARREHAARDAAALEAMRARDATRMAAMRSLSADPTAQLALLREIEDVDAPPPSAAQEAKRLVHTNLARAILTAPDAAIAVAISPDGARIAAAHTDHVVRIWPPGPGAPLELRGHTGAVLAVAFSPDGRHVASGALDNTVRIWPADGSAAARVLSHDGAVGAVAYSPDGDRLASGSDHVVRIWRLAGGAPLVLRGHTGDINAVAFSPDGRRVASASIDHTVRIWNADGSGAPIVLRGHDGEVQSVAFSPDGLRVVSGAQDNTARVWSADGVGEPRVLRGHDDTVNAAVFSPDGRAIATGSVDTTIRIWATDDRVQILRGHENGVRSLAYLPDGKRLVSGSIDKTLRIWDVLVRDEPLILPHAQPVHAAAFSPDGRQLVTGAWDKKLWLWNADGSSSKLLGAHDSAVTAAAFSPDGRRVVSASWDQTVRVWNVDGSGAPIVLRGHQALIGSAAFSPDGRRVVSASDDQTVRVWNSDGSGAPVVLRGHSGFVQSAAFSADGQRVVSVSVDHTVRVWNADGSGASLALLGHTDAVNAAAFSPDGRHIVSGSSDRTLRIWNADGSGAPVVLPGHEDTVWWVEYSPDGTRIVSASRDKTVRIWNADGSGAPIVLLGHDRVVRQARFSPDARSIVSASWDKTVRVWRDLAPFTFADPRIWSATSYCMPVARRLALLGGSQAQAERDLHRCEAHVVR